MPENTQASNARPAHIRVVGGTITDIVEGDYTIYATEGNIINNAATAVVQEGQEKGVSYGEYNEPSPPAGKYFQRGWWTDKNDKPITEATIGEKVKFHIQMDSVKVPSGSIINFKLKDWDTWANIDDAIVVRSTTQNPSSGIGDKITQIRTDASGKASIYITLSEGLIPFIEEEAGNEIELYMECSYYDESDQEIEKVDLPDITDNYLIVYEKEVLITVIIELPHSKETGWGAKGLAGHSAIAVGERYFDYGPYNYTDYYSETEYDADFNNDGDKVDNVLISEPNFKFAPGTPWWGAQIALKKGISVEEVTLEMVLNHIQLHWRGQYNSHSNAYPDATYIYGKVYQVEFYVKENEAKKISAWWEERYKHLKVYSVFPWTGEQCTTTVKTSIQQAFPTQNLNFIDDKTQRPSGLLSELKKFRSTSKQHFNEKVIVKVIKNEASDWVN